MSVKSAVVIDGMTNYLYPTFNDIDEALENLKKAIPTYYSYLQENIDLKATYGANYDVLLSTNFEPENEAIQALDKAISMNSISNKCDDITYRLTAEQVSLEEERQIFNAFLDIYENESKNNAIKALLTSNADIDREALAYLLPCNNPYVKNYFDGIFTQSSQEQLKISTKALEEPMP